MTLVICGTLIQNRTRIYIFSAKPDKVVVSVEHMKVLADDILGMSHGANNLTLYEIRRSKAGEI